MEITSIDIANCLTIIKYVSNKMAFVCSYKMSKFEDLISDLNIVKINANAIKPAKLKKYLSLLENKGFTLVEEEWNYNCRFNAPNDDCIRVSLIYSKVA